jgi:hypothetical protein
VPIFSTAFQQARPTQPGRSPTQPIRLFAVSFST